jgi:hypothetical protein
MAFIGLLYNDGMLQVARVSYTTIVACLMTAAVSWAQPTPRPFPTPGAPQPAKPATPQTPPPASTAPRPADPNAIPTEASLGLPIYPDAKFVTSYDAGQGQRYYLFGTTAGFAEVVAYYRTALKSKGELVFEQPATHMFEVGRFREETMAFPPGVTVKDYTWGGSQGFPNPKLGAQPARFPTIIQIVPLPGVVQ